MKSKETQSYIGRIRNKEKRRYAYDYLYHLRDGNPEPNTKDYNLSYMAMQDVRMELHNRIKE